VDFFATFKTMLVQNFRIGSLSAFYFLFGKELILLAWIVSFAPKANLAELWADFYFLNIPSPVVIVCDK